MPLFWLSLAFLIGILAASLLNAPIFGWILAGLGAIVLALPTISKHWIHRTPDVVSQLSQRLKIPSLKYYPLLIALLCMGAIRYQLWLPEADPASLAFYNDQPMEVVLQGVVVDPPDERESYTNLRVQVDQMRQPGEMSFKKVKGLLLTSVSPELVLRYGDRIRLEGKLQTPPENEDFSYRDYLARQSIFSYMPYPKVDMLDQGKGNALLSALYQLRERALDVINQTLPNPEAGLVAGVVLGVQSGITEETQEAFRETGTSHILVISGFNISVVAALFTLLFSKILGAFRGAVVAAVAIVLYALLVGGNPAVNRAAALGLVALLGHLLGRKQVGVNSLIFVAAIMALFTPTILWDVSFQLSFAATLGIMLYAEPLTEWFTNLASRKMSQENAQRIAAPVAAYVLLTLAAQITTLPLMIYYFKRLSLTSLIANPLILPAQPPLMVLGGIAALSGVLFKPLGQLFAWAAFPFSAYTIRVVEWISRIPHGSITLGQVALPGVILFYCLLISITVFRTQLQPMVPRVKPAIPLTVLGILTFLVWKAAFSAPDGLLHATVLDVGTGDALLIQTPVGRNVLVNGGARTHMLSEGLGKRLQTFHQNLDWLVIADIDDEDLAGISDNLERYSPANIWWAGNKYGSRSAQNLWADLEKASIPITSMQAGQTLDLGSGAELQVISTDSHGAVLFLSWGNFRFILPMGMDLELMENLERDTGMRNLPALLLAESGYAPLNPAGLINSLHPQLAVLGVAPADEDGLPSPESLEALEGYTLLRTDENGWIELTTDGQQMWVEVERK